MSSVITIDEDGVVYEGSHRLMKCPKCGEWNRVEQRSEHLAPCEKKHKGS